MDTITTKQEARDLILKCCKECISDNITELDFLFDSGFIKVEIPEGQQCKFRVFDTIQKAPKIEEFANLLESSSSGSLTLIGYDEHSSIVSGHYFKTLLSFNIDWNY